MKSASDARISPDGRLVAFVLTDPAQSPEGKPASRLWAVPAVGGAPARPLTTAGRHTDSHPRWSPDGAVLAFLSNRGDRELSQMQVYLLPMAAGGEAAALTSAPGGVESFDWSPDGSEIAFLARDPKPGREDPKDDVILYEELPLPHRLRVINVATRAVRDVTPANLQVWEYAWSPDGSHFSLVVSRQPYEWSWYESWLARMPAAGGEPTPVHRPGRQLALPVWSRDGREIAFLAGTWSDRGSVFGDVWTVPAAGGEAQNRTPGYEGSICWAERLPDGDLLVCGYSGFDAVIAALRPGEPLRPLWQGPVALAPRSQARISLSAGGGTVAAVREDTLHPPDVWTATVSPGGLRWQQVTDLNPQVQERALGRTEIMRWQGPGGLDIEGILVTPAGLEAGRRCPLVVFVHGGPTWSYQHRFSQGYSHLLAGMGCAVLLPNPRGSSARGAAFAEANLGDMGGADLEDIMAGVDACIDLGVTDAQRLGIAGWSYGGFMAAWAVTQTDRFKAAVAGAAVTNWLSFHGTTEIQTWDALYQQLDPGDPRYVWNSPVHHAHKVRTPTLVLHGERDTAVPAGQGYEFWRALRERGVESVLAIYPRAGHGPSERAHVRDMAQRMVGWFQRHLGFGDAAPPA